MSSYQRSLMEMDIASESYWKDKDKQKAVEARGQEEEAKSLYGFLGGGIGALIGGPFGWAFGTAAGTGLADKNYKSEDIKIRQGNFNKAQTEKFNDELSKWDKESDFADFLDIPVNLYQAYKWAGAFDDGIFNAKKVDPTKWAMPEGESLSSLEWITQFLKKNKTGSTNAEETNVSPFTINQTSSSFEEITAGSSLIPENNDNNFEFNANTPSSTYNTDNSYFQINDFHWNETANWKFGKNVKDLNREEHFELTDIIAESPLGLENWVAFGNDNYNMAYDLISTAPTIEAKIDAFNTIAIEPINLGVIEDMQNKMSFESYTVDQMLAIMFAESGGRSKAINVNDRR